MRSYSAVRYIDTPLGKMVAYAIETGICRLAFCTTHEANENFGDDFHKTQFAESKGDSPYFKVLEQQLERYFNKQLNQFNVPIALIGTGFQKRVWQHLLHIPYGQITTYKKQAIALGNISSIRATARANGNNPIAIIIPCHRVVGSNGSLTGYSGELWRKKELLKLEGAINQPELMIA